jgi:PAS domain S-box-containing protein
MDDAERLADFARLGADWLWETDAEDRFTYFSVPSTRTGVELACRLGQRRREGAIQHPDNVTYLAALEGAVARRESFRNFIYRGGLGTKYPHWCSLSGEPRYDSGGAFLGYRGVGSDVSERIDTQKKLESQSQALEAILGATPDGIQMIDSTRATLAVNDQIYEIQGIPNRKDQPGAESTLQSVIDMARRGEYGPGDPETLARQRVNAMLKQLTAQGSINYERQLMTGRWVETRLRGLKDGAALMLVRDISEAKEHAAELERKSALLSNIVSNIDGGIAVFDKSMCLMAWNERFPNMIGIDPELVRRGASARDLLVAQAKAGEFGPCDPEIEADLRLSAFHSDQPLVGERQRPNGRIVERRRNPVPGGGSVTTYIDVTERRQAEQDLQELNATLERRVAERTGALAEAERFQRALMSNLPGMVYRTKKRDGHWVLEFASEGCRKLLGISPDDLMSGRVRASTLIHPQERESVRAKVWTDLQVGESFELEYRVRRADGSWCWVLDCANAIRSEDGEVVTLEGVVLDINARKTVEQELERTREHLVDALDSLDQNLIIYDSDDCLVLSTRHLYEQFIAAADYFTPGKTFEEIFRYTVEAGAIAVPSGQTKEQFIADRVARHRRADGAITVRHLPDGRILHMTERPSVSGGIVAIARDVTEQIKIEERLRESQRMEAMGQLTGGLAHDLNNYLAVIMGNLDLLAERPHVDAETLALIEGALAGTQRGAELTRSLLAFSRRQPLDPKVLDVGARIADVARLLKRTIGEKVVLDVRLAPDLWPVEIDGAQLDSAVVNLANNARDAMPGGGSLTIEVRNATRGRAEEPLGDHVLIEVTDSGSGMDAATLAQAFEPFFSTKGPGHGTGLGLSMVHGFVHQSGGTIALASTVGKGTSVRIFLPRALECVAALPNRKSATLPRGTEHILVVEDNPDVREVVLDQLKSLGYRVTEVESGDDALKELEERAGDFDLVVSDVVMPGKIDGLALAEITRKRWPDLWVVLTTGFSDVIADGAEDSTETFTLLRKPYRKAELAFAVRAALEKRA